MKYYGVNLKGDLTRRTDFELIAPLLGEANKSYIQSLLDYREGNAARYYHSNVVDNIQGDVVTGRDDFFPGVPPAGEQIDITSLKGLIDGGNYWISRTSMGVNAGNCQHSTLSLTSDTGVVAGGYNGSGYNGLAQLHTNSTNYWRLTTDLVYSRYSSAGFSLTSNGGVISSGAIFGVGYSGLSEEYKAAEDTWSSITTRTIASEYPIAFSLTLDTGVVAGGSNGSGHTGNATRYSSTADSWTSRTPMTNPHTGGGGSSFTTDIGLAGAGGNGSGYHDFVETYSDSSNAWTSKTDVGASRQISGPGGVSQTTDKMILSCGIDYPGPVRAGRSDQFSLSANSWIAKTNNPQATSYRAPIVFSCNSFNVCGGNYPAERNEVHRFKDSSTIFDNQTLSTYQHPNAAVPKTDVNYYGDNLVPNGDMELDDDTWIDFGTPSLNARDSYKFSGNYSRKLQTDGNNEGMRMADHKAMTTETGKTYKFSVMVYAQTNSNVYIQINRGDGGSAQAFTYSSLTTPAWNLVEFEYVETSGGNNCIIYLVSGGGAGNTYYFDDVQFKEVLETKCAKNIVFTKDLSHTTDEIKHIVVTTLNQKRDPVTMNGYWTFRNPMVPSRATEGSFGLTDDFAIVSGGWVSSAFNDTNRYVNSKNAWTARTNILTARSSFDGFKLDTNYGVMAGGTTTGVNFTNTTDKYNNAGDVWAARTGMNIARIYCRSFPLTSDTGLVCNGNNGTQYLGNVERHSDSGNSWTNRTPTLDNVVSPGGFDLTEDLGIINGGYNNSAQYKDTVWRYSDSGNAWINRTVMSQGRRQQQCFKLTTTTGVMAGGYNGASDGWLYHSEHFDDSQNAISTRTDLLESVRHGQGIDISTSYGLVAGGYVGGGTVGGHTQRFVNSEISSIQQPTIDISLSGNDDESQEFDLKDQPLDTLIDLTGNVNTGGWTSISSLSFPRMNVQAFGGINTTKGIVCGGNNTSNLSVVQRYDDSENAWYQRTDLPEVRLQGAGFGITSNLGIVASGYNASATVQVSSVRYNDTGNSWASRGNINTAVFDNVAFGLDSDKGICATGSNGTNLGNTERYSDSGNSWTNRTALSAGKKNAAAFNFTTDTGVLAGGENSTSILNTTDLYSNSGNSWTSKAHFGINRRGAFGIELTSSTGLMACGENSLVYMSLANKYSGSTNVWSSREGALFGQANGGDINLSSTTGVVAGGRSDDYISTVQRYNDEGAKSILEPAGIWQQRTNCLSGGTLPCGVGLTDDMGIQSGGHLGFWNNTVEKYTNSSNGWIQRVNNPETKYGSSGFSLESNKCIVAGGRNATFSARNDRFEEANNIWVSRTAMTTARSGAADFGINSNQGIVASGENGSTISSVERFNDSGNNWTTRTSVNLAVKNPAGFTLNSGLGIKAAGWDAYSTTNVVEKYSNVNNNWIYVSGLSDHVYQCTGFELNGDKGIVCSGRRSSGDNFANNTNRYSNTDNIWSSRTEKITKVYAPGSYGSGASKQQGILAGGLDPRNVKTVERYTDSAIAATVNPAGYWTYRTEVGTRRYGGAGITLTTNTGLFCSGNNGSTYVDNTDKYDDTENTWSSRSAARNRQDGTAWGLSSDYGIFANGYNASYLGNTDRYSDSGDSWTARTAGFVRDSCSGFGLDTDLGITAGGNNGAESYQAYVQRFSETGNAWTSRTSLNTGKFQASGVGLTSDIGVEAAGTESGGYSVKTERYSDSGNSWVSVADKPASATNMDAFKISDNLAITAGGKNGIRLQNSDKFHNAENTWSVRAPMNRERSRVAEFAIGSSQGIVAGGRAQTLEYIGTTERFTDTYTSEAINPYYKLRLKFNLYRDIQGDSWTNRTSSSNPRGWIHGFSLTSDQGISSGGYNGSEVNTNEKYTNSTDNWSSRTSMPTTKYAGAHISFTSDHGIVAGGYDTGADSRTDMFSDSSNVWVNKTGISIARYYLDGFSLTTNQCIVAGGNNTSGPQQRTESYSSSSNNWTTKTNLTIGSYDHTGCELTSDSGVVSGGNNSTNQTRIEKFTNSTNTWAYRSTSSITKGAPVGFSLSSSSCFYSSGQTNSFAEKFNDIGNVWISKQSPPQQQWGNSEFSLGFGQGIAGPGYKSGSLSGSTERYTDGECSFSGFAVQTLK